ncbi:putative clathrin assembly protein At5g35200 [Hibiscus syriacus]|uniref:putative clathrin assembly protein At5g35200 n=1 Tax=Hibiscus syriacus TaxID=106335 RepID=UPI00192225A4|nr:putative clathrin assembly protein At5g35200 [Hibiscus syriacus]
MPQHVEAHEGASPTESTAPVPDLLSGDIQDDGAQETTDSSSNQASSDTMKAVANLDIGDLISFDEPGEESSELIDNNPLALAIVDSENPPYYENVKSSAPASTGWELALCNSPTSNGAAVADNKMTGRLNGLTPQGVLATNQQMAFNFGPVSANPFDINYNSRGPFYGSSYITHQTDVQMPARPQHPIYFMQQQPHMAMTGYHSFNPLVMADYNQVPTFYGCSNATPLTSKTLATMAPHQADLMQQPALAMVDYNPPKPSGNPFDM